MSFFGRGSRKLQRLFAREDHSRACLVGQKPIDPLATQLALENNWPRVPVEQSGEASDMMRTESVSARAALRVDSPRPATRSALRGRTFRAVWSLRRHDSTGSRFTLSGRFCPANPWRSGPGGLSCPGRVYFRPTEQFANCREDAHHAMRV